MNSKPVNYKVLGCSYNNHTCAVTVDTHLAWKVGIIFFRVPMWVGALIPYLLAAFFVPSVLCSQGSGCKFQAGELDISRPS